jgi:endonuclease YncB( thermonuclease family)
MRPSIVIAAEVLALVLFATTVSAGTWQGATYEGVVARVVDGDTVQVQMGDRVETVRYIGISIPEIEHPTGGRARYGEVARTANRQLVEGRAVRLILDVQPRDRYGRLLAYVYVDGQLVNAELVRRGYAEAATQPPNVKYHRDFVELQRQARQTRAGLWADLEAVRAHKPRQSGVAGVKNVLVYLHPLDPSWMQRPAEQLVYFENVAEARAAGYIQSLDYHQFEAREREALAGGAAPFVSTLSHPGSGPAMSPPASERRERPRLEPGEADEPDPSAVVDWLLNRRNRVPKVTTRSNAT